MSRCIGEAEKSCKEIAKMIQENTSDWFSVAVRDSVFVCV